MSEDESDKLSSMSPEEKFEYERAEKNWEKAVLKEAERLVKTMKFGVSSPEMFESFLNLNLVFHYKKDICMLIVDFWPPKLIYIYTCASKILEKSHKVFIKIIQSVQKPCNNIARFAIKPCHSFLG